jgi:hypothetical protein
MSMFVIEASASDEMVSFAVMEFELSEDNVSTSNLVCSLGITS